MRLPGSVMTGRMIVHMLTREDFLKPSPPTVVRCDVPEMGGHVFCRSLTSRERSLFDRSFVTAKGSPNLKRQAELRERMLLACVCNESGELLFREGDLEAISRQPAAVIERIVEVCQPLCGLASDADLEKKSID